ncbi:hypothetical protein SAMN02982927_02659 [Sporolactobacillus nakayamae]|uniref:Uncharacterized protein n=1 Tax=Sporolactobacillus nakayamae TaxID=269670 RepID=A0A1I2UDJ1_9BACL|nr:hypothetical protein SAMN02982927_02659 [Sporolactobacillus nakayamae]
MILKITTKIRKQKLLTPKNELRSFLLRTYALNELKIRKKNAPQISRCYHASAFYGAEI